MPRNTDQTFLAALQRMATPGPTQVSPAGKGRNGAYSQHGCRTTRLNHLCSVKHAVTPDKAQLRKTRLHSGGKLTHTGEPENTMKWFPSRVPWRPPWLPSPMGPRAHGFSSCPLGPVCRECHLQGKGGGAVPPSPLLTEMHGAMGPREANKNFLAATLTKIRISR